MLSSALPGCTFIIEPPPDTGSGAGFYAPFSCLPITLDATSGEAQLADEPSDLIVDLVFAVRISRGTASVAGPIELLMQETVLAMAGLGAQVRSAAILPLDERPTTDVYAGYGCGLDSPQDLLPSTVLLHYAASLSLPEAPLGCADDPLVRAGARFDTLTTQYPAGLNGQSGRVIFGSKPTALVVVHLDTLARLNGFDDPECAGVRTLAALDAGASWARYDDGVLPADRVIHWMIATDEEVDDVTLADRCLSLQGFPTQSFDALEASPKALFGPLSTQVERSGGMASDTSFCHVLVDDKRREFIAQQVGRIADLLGVPVNAELLLALLETGGVFGLDGVGGE